jgi:hypothetical protein
MSSRQKRAIAIGFLLLATSIGVGFTFAQPAEPIEPETLLPASSVLYIGVDGGAEHQAAWEQTAAYDALYKSGLMNAVAKLFADLQSATGGQQGMAGQVGGAIEHVRDNGVSFAVALNQAENQPPLPWAILIAHNAGMYEEGMLQLAMMASRGEIKFEKSELHGRNVTHGTLPQGPGIEIGWWAEGEHLVIVAGLQAVENALQVADGGANITTNELWTEYVQGDADFDVASVGWFDFEALLEAFGPMPLPNSRNETHPAGVSVLEAAEMAGLDGLESIVGRAGYKDRALWSEVDVNAPGERHGLLALLDQKTISLDDLPSLPIGAAGFTASSLDWAQTYDALLEVAKKIEALMPPAQQGQIDAALAQAEGAIGFKIRDDLLEPLGHVHCGYADAYQGPFGLGVGVVVSVDDAEKLRSSLDKLLQFAQQQAQGRLQIEVVEKQSQRVVLLNIGVGTFTPSFSINDDWFAIGMVPQTVEAFLMRENDVLPSWEPDEDVQAALDALPKEFTAITVSDPREVTRLIAGLAPFGLGIAKAAVKQAQVFPPDFEFSLSVADLPPAEVIAQPLFPNVAVAEVDEEGVTYTSRSSLSGIPMGGTFDGGTSVATTAVLAALLLPAVQQAREAARRTQSKNNLKQIMLAMHNYHDANNHFPEGTVPNEKLDPDERLSWLAKILPYLDQAPLYNMIDFEGGWEDEANATPLKTPLTVYRNPSQVDTPSEYGVTDYVGIAGVGEDGPMLPVTSNKAGVFAYNRATKIQDIRDGTSNTICVTDTSEPTPWGQGGPSIRSLTEKPYINGPDGIGGPHVGGIHAGLCDGSVRFISENIDPGTFEALTTINGGEVLGDF